jgi:hypothetical protein
MTKKTTMKLKSAEAESSQVCLFHSADGRRCGMLRWNRNRRFCLFHARQEQQLLHLDYIGDKLPTISGKFRTALDVNCALGELYDAMAHNHVPPRNAAALAYIAQLIIQTLPQVKSEIIRYEGEEGWDATLHDTFDAQIKPEPEADPKSGSEPEQSSEPADPAPENVREN